MYKQPHSRVCGLSCELQHVVCQVIQSFLPATSISFSDLPWPPARPMTGRHYSPRSPTAWRDVNCHPTLLDLFTQVHHAISSPLSLRSSTCRQHARTSIDEGCHHRCGCYDTELSRLKCSSGHSCRPRSTTTDAKLCNSTRVQAGQPVVRWSERPGQNFSEPLWPPRHRS